MGPDRSTKRGPKPPAIFGPYDRTAILMCLAQIGRARGPELKKRFGNVEIAYLQRADKAGLTLRYQGSGVRGQVYALNPRFPLAELIRDLLLSLAREYPVNLVSDVRPEERTMPPAVARNRKIATENLFGTKLRTHLLMALELHGGTASLSRLAFTVPNEHYESVRTAAAVLVKAGVLAKRRGVVSFVNAPWLPALRHLIRGYMKLERKVADACKEQIELEKQWRGSRNRGLLGPPNVERVLRTLAENGPMNYTRLMAAARTKGNAACRNPLKLGVLASKNVGRARIIGLNARYPIYKELHTFLLDGASTRNKRSNDIGRLVAFEVDSLLATSLQTEVLLLLKAVRTGEIDAATVKRLTSADSGSIGNLCKRLENRGILKSRYWKGITLYSFDQAFDRFASLMKLLSAALRYWPAYVESAALAEALYPRQRRARHRIGATRRQK